MNSTSPEGMDIFKTITPGRRKNNMKNITNGQSSSTEFLAPPIGVDAEHSVSAAEYKIQHEALGERDFAAAALEYCINAAAAETNQAELRLACESLSRV